MPVSLVKSIRKTIFSNLIKPIGVQYIVNIPAILGREHVFYEFIGSKTLNTKKLNNIHHDGLSK